MSLANTMIGSAVIIYPVLFIKDGMIGSSIIMLVVGCIQFITCRLLVIHNRPDEIDFNVSILRIGGVKLSKINSFVNMFLLFFVCIAYYLLISTNFFQISVALIKSFKDFTPPDSNTINFNEYSMQWSCIICSVVCISTLFKTDVDPILKLIRFSIYCVAAYFLFVFANLVRQLVEGNIVFS
jgi:sodium-coupled neutral amino acid transporter 9